MTIRKVLVGTAIVQQKRLGRKWSWTEHAGDREKGDRAAQRAANSPDLGRPYRFIYRINVYRKEVM